MVNIPAKLIRHDPIPESTHVGGKDQPSQPTPSVHLYLQLIDFTTLPDLKCQTPTEECLPIAPEPENVSQ